MTWKIHGILNVNYIGADTHYNMFEVKFQMVM